MVSERVKVHVGLAAALMVFVGSVSLLVGGTLYRGDLHAALPGSVAPDFSLRDADNAPVALSELRGNVVIVYFHGRDVASSDVATPESSGSTSGAAINSPAVSAQQQSFMDGTTAKDVSVPAADSSHAVAQLSEICREAHNSRLKVLELDSPESMGTSVGNADTLAQADANSPVQSQASAASPVRTLFDLSGDVARMYKIDSGEPKPTFFVIDPSGVIRYRGNSLQSNGVSAADSLLAPATQPSSCPQVLQTLLSTEAVDLTLPASSTRF